MNISLARKHRSDNPGVLQVSENYIRQQVQTALDEDIGSGDATAALISAEQQVTASLICREQAILCGTAWFDMSFQLLDPSIQIEWSKHDGDQLGPNETICSISGAGRPILTGERTALNFLQTLSGTATTTRRYVDAISDTNCTILDTRKTLPGLRLAQKYAVQCAGAKNHRIGLYDAILIKENHIHAAGTISHAVKIARQQSPQLFIEVEVETLAQLEEAIACNVSRVLLDNMSVDTLSAAVKLAAGRIETEASGGIDLTNIRPVAETGINYISIGSITKHLQATDFSLRFS